jgi:hypothetical protein
LNLFHVSSTPGIPRFALRVVEHAHTHGAQGRDDGNHHEKFNEGKTAAFHRYLYLTP